MNKFITFIACALLSLAAHAAPQLAQWGVTVNAGASVYPGNVIFSDCKNPNVDATGDAIEVDQTGAEVHRWHAAGYMLPWLVKPLGTDGSLLAWRYASTTGNCQHGTGNIWMVKVAPDGTSTKIYNDLTCKVNHDFQAMPDGSFYVLCRKLITDTAVSSAQFYDDIIRHISASGAVLWEWSTDAHYSQLGISSAGQAIIAAGQTLYPPQDPVHDPVSSDVFHTNSIQVIPDNASCASIPAFCPGNIMVSQRNTNLIFIIDVATGNIVWQVGNISIGQHTAKVIHSGLPGDGHILMLNNGSWGGYPMVVGFLASSSIVEYDPIQNGVVWSWQSPYPLGKGFFTPWMGSTQRLPNGNTFVDEAQYGRIFEVSPTGQIVWEYVPQIGSNSLAPDREFYRAYKLELCWPGCPADGTSFDGAWYW